MLVSDVPPSLDRVLAGTEQVVQAQQLESGISTLRLSALKSVALSFGTQAGYARRTYEIREQVQSRSNVLDRVYDFQGVMLDRNVLPPVLVEFTNTLSLAGEDALRLSDHTYRISSQARFVSAVPSWREYLLTSVVSSTGAQDLTLVPRDENEKRFWEAQVRAGWQAGVQQADQVFAVQLARLDRDFKGMVLYRHLLSLNMVSKPFVAESNMGVTGDGSQIAINDRVLRITALPQLEMRAEEWRAKLVPAVAPSSGAGP